MARKPLRSQLNQIRAWVRQGRTDAWIAHQLDIPASELREFRRRHELAPEEEDAGDLELRDEIEAEIEQAALEEETAAARTDDEEDEDGAAKPMEEARAARTATPRAPGAVAGAAGAAAAGGGAPGPPCRRPSTTAPTTASGSGSIRRSRTIRSTPSTGPATGRSR